MLTLARYAGQFVILHDPNTMEVLGRIIYHGSLNNRNPAIRLGFDFPASIAINREEIYDAMLKEKKEAWARDAANDNTPQASNSYYDGAAIREVPKSPVVIVRKQSKLNRGCAI
jgi:sRNA-binding carbon storage regulator CsrA